MFIIKNRTNKGQYLNNTGRSPLGNALNQIQKYRQYLKDFLTYFYLKRDP